MMATGDFAREKAVKWQDREVKKVKIKSNGDAGRRADEVNRRAQPIKPFSD